MRSVAFIGYGDFAHALASALSQEGIEVRAYVRPRGNPGAAAIRDQRMRSAGVRATASPGEALEGADIAIAAVPASSAAEVVAVCAPQLAAGQIYVDPSSALPSAKRSAAGIVEAAGAQYVDVAVLGTVIMSGAQVPMLAAGAGAAEWQRQAAAAGLNVTAIAGRAGDAALVKLLRSVYMKGRDALVFEMLLAARRHGVQDAVLASIGGPGEQVPFPNLAERVVCSLAVYAERRADELADAASLLHEVGIEPLMARAGEDRLRRLASSGVSAHFGGERPRDLAEVMGFLEALDAERGVDAAANG